MLREVTETTKECVNPLQGSVKVAGNVFYILFNLVCPLCFVQRAFEIFYSTFS